MRTFAEFTNRYTQVVTLNDDERRYVARLVAEFGALPVSALRLDVLDPWWSGVLEEGKPATANKIRSRLSHMLNMARRWDLIRDNPVAWLKKARQNPARTCMLTPEQRKRLVAAANPRLRLYILAARYTAGRRASLRKLQERDVDLTRGTITFRGTKNGDDVMVPLSPELRRAFQPLLTGNPDAYLLHPYQLNSITKAFSRLTRRLGIRGVRFHDLRHDTASSMVEAGAPLPVIQRMLGHRSASQTFRYAHTPDATLRKYAGML